MERKSRMPQIQGVQRRMPYAAASQQPPTASFGMRLYTQAPEIGVSCCSAESSFQPNSRFPEGETKWSFFYYPIFNWLKSFNKSKKVREQHSVLEYL